MAGRERSESRPRRARNADDGENTVTRPAVADDATAEPAEPAEQARQQPGQQPAERISSDAQDRAEGGGEPTSAEPSSQPTSSQSPQSEPAPTEPALSQPAPSRPALSQPAPSQPEASQLGSEEPAEQHHQRTTEERIAAARRAERLAELRQRRDSISGDPLHRADRPDVGHRRNIVEAVPRPPRRHRGLVGGSIALLLVAVLVVGFLVVNGRRGEPVAGTPASTPTSQLDTDLISGRTMLTPELAGSVIHRNWRISADQPTETASSPVPACLTRSDDDAPTPSDGMVRTLTTVKTGPSALHLVQAYKSSEVAAEAFALVAKSLGECNLQGSYIRSARVITGLGDQATGVVLDDPIKDSHRAVVANRTGRLVNVIDIVQTKDTPDIDRTAGALGQLTDQQCTLAVGICASLVNIADGPPPVGGDQPGFLTLADIPVPTGGRGTWGGLEPGSSDDIVTSGCEDVEFGRLSADNRAARSYVLTDKPKGMPKTFGLDEIALTMKSDKDAADQAKQIAKNIKTCHDRLPTASTSGLTGVTGTGADGTQISGSVGLVTQKVSQDETSKYRVGIVAAGNKLVYTFLSRSDGWDLTDDQWKTVTVRAAQRASQIR